MMCPWKVEKGQRRRNGESGREVLGASSDVEAVPVYDSQWLLSKECSTAPSFSTWTSTSKEKRDADGPGVYASWRKNVRIDGFKCPR